MATRARVRTWIALAVLAGPSAAAGQDRTEREIVDLIVRDGPQATAIRAEADVTRHEQLARQAFPNPGFMFSREGAGFTEFYQAEQSLPIFGSRRALSRAGAAATASAEAERDARLWSLRSEAAHAVARLVAEQARFQAARAQVREVEHLIDILRTREKEGEGSRFDRMRAEQELRESRQVETAAAVEVAEARAMLTRMLPRDVPVTAIAAAAPAVQTPPGIDALTTRAIAARAELRVLQGSGERAAFEADAARKARLPSPTVFGGVKRADNGPVRETGGVFGVSVSLPLFDAGARDASRWEAERTRVEAERAAIEYRIRGEVAAASEVLTMRQAALAQDQQGAADELVQIAEVAYREGEVGILELLDAVRTAFRARVRSIELRRDARLAQIGLERAVGDVLWP